MNALLTGLGLSQKAATIYLAALALGTASVQDIAGRAGLKRPTTYLHITELLEAGLLRVTPIGKKRFYQAVEPAALEALAARRLADVQQLLPDLEAMKASALGRPNITILEGEAGLQQVYDEICQANSIRFWSQLATFEAFFETQFAKISQAIRTNEITTREIIANTPEAKRSAIKYAAAAGRTYSARLATTDKIHNDNAIYGDVIALFRIQAQNFYVVRIEDAMLAESMKTIFDMAWESAIPFKKELKATR